MTAVTATAQSLGVLLGLHFIEKCGRRTLVLSSLSLVRTWIVNLRTILSAVLLNDTKMIDDTHRLKK